MKDQPRHDDISWKLKDLFYPPKIFFIPRIFNKVISVKILVRVTTCSYIMLLNSTMHNKHYLGMNEGMNESSLRCFDDNLVKKQGRTYSTDRSSLARYCDISFFKVQPRTLTLAGSSKIFFIPHRFFYCYHTMVVEQIGILTRRSRVTCEARALTTNRMLTISLNST
jgi:hypothetical protein